MKKTEQGVLGSHKQHAAINRVLQAAENTGNSTGITWRCCTTAPAVPPVQTWEARIGTLRKAEACLTPMLVAWPGLSCSLRAAARG